MKHVIFIQNFIKHAEKMLDEMLDWFAPAIRKLIRCSSKKKQKARPKKISPNLKIKSFSKKQYTSRH